MQNTNTQFENKLNNLASFLESHISLANAHNSDFFSSNHWSNILPLKIRDCLNDIELNQLFTKFKLFNINESLQNDENELDKFVHDCAQHSLSNLNILTDIKFFYDHYTNIIKHPIIEPFLPKKKLHEVYCMGELITSICKFHNTNKIVDFGSGRGYLSNFLALTSDFNVLGIESNTTISKSAFNRNIKLNKYWNSLVAKVDKDFVKKDMKSNFKTINCCITNELKLNETLMDNFPSADNTCALVGLHTCGSLSVSLLNLFLENPNAQSMVNVSCCYQHIYENDFPLSSILKNRGFKLSRNAKMLASQAIDRLEYNNKSAITSILWRCALQQILINLVGPSKIENSFKIGKLAKKCNSFVEYCRKSFQLFEINDESISDNDLQMVLLQLEKEKNELNYFFKLRTLLAPSIESIILLDRVCYLQENNIKNVYIVKLFDSLTSPRCYAIVCDKL